MFKYLIVLSISCLPLLFLSCREGEDPSTPTTPSPPPMRRFSLPLAIGNTWTYQYSGSRRPNDSIWGIHTWRITESITDGYRVMNVRQDSILYGQYPLTLSTDTVYFSILMTTDTVTINFPERTSTASKLVGQIPLSFKSWSDTLVLDYTTPYRNFVPYDIVTYVSGVGLTKYFNIGGTTMSRERATLNLLNYTFH